MPNGDRGLGLYYGAERLIFCFDIGTTMSRTLIASVRDKQFICIRSGRYCDLSRERV